MKIKIMNRWTQREETHYWQFAQKSGAKLTEIAMQQRKEIFGLGRGKAKICFHISAAWQQIVSNSVKNKVRDYSAFVLNLFLIQVKNQVFKF